MWRRWMNMFLHFDDLTYVIKLEAPQKPSEDAPAKEWEAYDEQWNFDNKSINMASVDRLYDR